MLVLNKTIVTNRDWYSLYLFGDLHIGQESCDLDMIEEAAKYLAKKKLQEGCTFVLGDLIENVVLGSKGTAFDLSIADPEKQIDKAASYLELFKHNLLVSVEGNHELRTRHRTGQFLGKNILEKVFGKEAKDHYLGVCGIVNLTFKNSKGKTFQNYKIFVTHGNGNSSATGGKITKIHALRDRADADLYFQGHIHQKLGMSDYIIKDDKLKKRIFASCSSYLFDAEYAQEFGFKPSDYGINTINVNTREFNMLGYY